MKRFNDDAGADLAPIVIFSILFLVLTLAVVPQMVEVFYSNTANNGNSSRLPGYSMIGGHQYQMWKNLTGSDNESVAGRVTEWGDWTDKQLHQAPAGPSPNTRLNTRVHFEFYDQAADPVDHHKLAVWVVRNNTEYANHLGDLTNKEPFVQTNGMRDFIFFREFAWSGGLWDNTRNFYDVISFSQLINPANQVDAGNLTACSVLGKFNITFFAGPTIGSGLTLLNATLLNQFTIQVGSDLMNLHSRAHIGMWNIVGYLFLFDAEDLGMPEWLAYFIGAILWICVGFAVVGIISRFIPTIPGL
jgi:hypothetical protein